MGCVEWLPLCTSEYLHKSRNVSVLIYHFVCSLKCLRVIFSKSVDDSIVTVCSEISKHYEINFIEVGVENDHVYFLIQCVPTYVPTKIVTILKSIFGRELFKVDPEIKK